ncbi:hypothetical protein HDV05_002331 [Chytridiales sp. JEL 0842]|nr:hypothetical protein HDV05_002331 [Chytridiales sp. JEL 0842]
MTFKDDDDRQSPTLMEDADRLDLMAMMGGDGAVKEQSCPSSHVLQNEDVYDAAIPQSTPFKEKMLVLDKEDDAEMPRVDSSATLLVLEDDQVHADPSPLSLPSLLHDASLSPTTATTTSIASPVVTDKPLPPPPPPLRTTTAAMSIITSPQSILQQKDSDEKPLIEDSSTAFVLNLSAHHSSSSSTSEPSSPAFDSEEEEAEAEPIQFQSPTSFTSPSPQLPTIQPPSLNETAYPPPPSSKSSRSDDSDDEQDDEDEQEYPPMETIYDYTQYNALINNKPTSSRGELFPPVSPTSSSSSSAFGMSILGSPTEDTEGFVYPLSSGDITSSGGSGSETFQRRYSYSARHQAATNQHHHQHHHYHHHHHHQQQQPTMQKQSSRRSFSGSSFASFLRFDSPTQTQSPLSSSPPTPSSSRGGIYEPRRSLSALGVYTTHTPTPSSAVSSPSEPTTNNSLKSLFAHRPHQRSETPTLSTEFPSPSTTSSEEPEHHLLHLLRRAKTLTSKRTTPTLIKETLKPPTPFNGSASAGGGVGLHSRSRSCTPSPISPPAPTTQGRRRLSAVFVNTKISDKRESLSSPTMMMTPVAGGVLKTAEEGLRVDVQTGFLRTRRRESTVGGGAEKRRNWGASNLYVLTPVGVLETARPAGVSLKKEEEGGGRVCVWEGGRMVEARGGGGVGEVAKEVQWVPVCFSSTRKGKLVVRNWSEREREEMGMNLEGEQEQDERQGAGEKVTLHDRTELHTVHPPIEGYFDPLRYLRIANPDVDSSSPEAHHENQKRSSNLSLSSLDSTRTTTPLSPSLYPAASLYSTWASGLPTLNNSGLNRRGSRKRRSLGGFFGLEEYLGTSSSPSGGLGVGGVGMQMRSKSLQQAGRAGSSSSSLSGTDSSSTLASSTGTGAKRRSAGGLMFGWKGMLPLNTGNLIPPPHASQQPHEEGATSPVSASSSTGIWKSVRGFIDGDLDDVPKNRGSWGGKAEMEDLEEEEEIVGVLG